MLLGSAGLDFTENRKPEKFRFSVNNNRFSVNIIVFRKNIRFSVIPFGFRSFLFGIRIRSEHPFARRTSPSNRLVVCGLKEIDGTATSNKRVLWV